jgi:TonB family protein
MSRARWCNSWVVAGLLFSGLLVPPNGVELQGQETARKLKTSVPPDARLAHKLNIKGTARVQLTVTPDGAVKEVKELGGNPVLLQALMDAVKQWKYEPAGRESLITVKFEFGQ